MMSLYIIDNYIYTYNYSPNINQFCKMEFNFFDTFKTTKLTSPHKILQTLKKVQFIAQFVILSKYSHNQKTIAEFLIAFEAVKCYFKVAHFAHQQGIYVESQQQKAEQKQKMPIRPLQKMSLLLQKIKTKPYEQENNQPQQFQQLASGKKMQLVTSVKVPEKLKRTKLSFAPLLGQVLTLLRPLISILAIRLYGMNNYKSYLISLGIDLVIVLVLQRNLKVRNKIELQELEKRKKELITRYIFRRPLFLVLKRIIFEPLLQKIISKDRWIYKIILSILQMQSSITLTV